MDKKFAIRAAAPKRRNMLALLVRKRVAGKHNSRKREENEERKDLLQRLREAGL